MNTPMDSVSSRWELERERESKWEREREVFGGWENVGKWKPKHWNMREVFGGRENEGKWKPKHWNVWRFFYFYFYEKDWVEFGYIVFGLNGAQCVFS